MTTTVLTTPGPLIAEVLRHDGIVAFPTESFYGLAASPWSERAVARLLALKGERQGKPLLLVLASLGAVLRVASVVPPELDRLAERFWPGPLTVVLPAREDLAAGVSAGTASVGVRVPGRAEARALAALAGGAVTASSANPSGAPPPRDVAQVLAYFGERIELILDGGETAGGLPSTILDLTCQPARILREGAISSAALGSLVTLG